MRLCVVRLPALFMFSCCCYLLCGLGCLPAVTFVTFVDFLLVLICGYVVVVRYRCSLRSSRCCCCCSLRYHLVRCCFDFYYVV